MIQLEIYAHESLEKPIINALVPVPPGTHDPEGKSGRPFSLFHNVAGRGLSGTSMGDDVWPETNIKMVLYINDQEREEILESISRLRSDFPQLGLAVFVKEGFSAW